ncbi:MAG TPA: glycerol-3-phosphate 1-O-acyltransferase PlsY [Firmicutes bacterium]|nr:glycerol-3-phosphate 1-O-acyltransferase PlsY [Candidatus Fermentithermobacillaceae bacterium]
MNPGFSLTVLLCALAYLLGSVPFGFLAAKMAGLDITKQGSGNTGATNVLRTLGPKYAVPVLALDLAKGAVSAYAGLRLTGMGTLGALLVGAAAVAGHNWSVFLRFRGGKGVASSAGVILVAFPLLLLAALGVFVLIVAVTRYVSLGSLLGAWTAVALSFTSGYDLTAQIPVTLLAAAITYQHRANIKRLLTGTELKITSGKGGTSR